MRLPEMEQCPTPEQLRRLLASEMGPDEGSVVEAHVGSCLSCQDQLAHSTDDPETVGWRSLVHPVTTSGEGCIDEDFLRSLKALMPDPHKENEAGPEGNENGPTVHFPGPPTSDGPLGQIGPYAVVKYVGAGATCYVYQAYDRTLSRPVALKVLKPDWVLVGNSRARFKREAKMSAGIGHENVVAVYNVGGDDHDFPLPFIVMEYVEGETLSGRIERTGPLVFRAAAEITRQVALGLSRAHARGLVHRDVKSSNVFLESGTGRAKLGDFGLAGAVAGEGPTEERFTRTGVILGTPAYMSPEQILSPSQADARSDVYGLGVVLYEALTGAVPFRGPTRVILHQVVHSEPDSPRSLNDQIPRDLETVTLKCLEKDPQRRYPSADALAEDLARWLSGCPIQARPTTAMERAWKWAKRRPATAALLGTLIAAVVVIVATVLTFNVYLQRSLTETRKARDLIKIERDQSLTQLQRQGMAESSRRLKQNNFDGLADLESVPQSRRGWEWDRVFLEYDLIPRPLEVVGNHGHGVLAGLISRDGKTVVTSGQDGRVIAWDSVRLTSREVEPGSWSERIARWRHITTPRNGDEPTGALAPDAFLGLCWLGEGTHLAGASLKGKGVVWETDGGKRNTILSHDAPLTTVAASPDSRVLLWGDDRGVLLLQDLSGTAVRRFALKGSSPVLRVLALGATHWLVGQVDGSVSVLDGRLSTVVAGETVRGPAWDLDLSPDGTLLAVACAESGVATFLIDRAQPALRRTESFGASGDAVEEVSFQAVRFAAGGESLGAADAAGRLHLWTCDDRRPLFTTPAQADKAARPEWPRYLHRVSPVLLFAPDGRTLYTAGLDTAVKRWDTTVRRAVTSWGAGAGAFARFDGSDPALLWVGAKDGTLSLWNTLPGHVAQVTQSLAHNGAVTGLDLAPGVAIVASCGDDRSVAFWANRSGRIDPVLPRIIHEHPLRSVAISPDGVRVAAYDAEDVVTLWDRGTGRRLSRLPMREAGEARAVAGQVAFNAGGTLLAALGPGQSLWLLDGQTLDVRNRLDGKTVAGEGGTAVAWDPADPHRVLAGDASGRVVSFSPTPEAYDTREHWENRVAGVAFSPRGERCAAVCEDGTFSVYDPRGAGRVFEGRSMHERPTGLHFDATGRRLALVHSDGRIDIWESQAPVIPPREGPRRAWTETVLCEGETMRRVWLRPSHVAVSAQGTLQFLSLRTDEDRAGASHCRVVLGEWRHTGYRELVLRDLGRFNSQGIDNINFSLGLAVHGREAWAVVGQPTESTVGQVFLYRVPVETPDAVSEWALSAPEALMEPGNWGFFPYLRADPTGGPEILHFSFSGISIHRSRREGDRWVHERVGRQGDGLYLKAAPGPDSGWHALFSPNRSPLTYIASGDTETREVVDPTTRLGASSLGVSADGLPVVLLVRRKADGGEEVVVARRQAGEGWSREVAFDGRVEVLSEAVCDWDGTVRFAYKCRRDRRIMLATGKTGMWRVERVMEIPGPPDGDPAADMHGLVLRLDEQGRPLVLAASRGGKEGWVRLYRPVQ